MFEFLLPILKALGMGAGGAGLGAGGLAAGSALTAPALMGGAGAGGLAGLTGATAPTVGPTLGAAAGLGAGAASPGFFSSMFPNAAKFGTAAKAGSFRGMGSALGNMAGGQSLGSMIENPSWRNAGALSKDLMNPENPLSPLSRGKQQPMAMPSPQGRSQVPQTDDPILQQMNNVLNPQRTQSGMKSWGQSPYPRKMSAI